MAMDQKKANTELAAWLEARQSALKIVKTTKTPGGQTVDWIPIESQVAKGKIASPPPAHVLPARVQDSRRPVTPVTFDLDDPKVERGPARTVPVVRPDLSRMTSTVELKDYLTKKGGLLVNRQRRSLKATVNGQHRSAEPTDPDPAGYFHDTDNQNGTFYGWDGFLNVWDPKINTPAGNGGDHSILQVWLQNYDKSQTQSLEGGWTVDQSLNGDTQPHVFTYFTTNGYTTDGDNVGGYNRLHKGWIQYSPSVFPGIRINGLSTFGGGQTDVSMKFQLYHEPNSKDVNWWVAVQGIWMGYYPTTLYNGGLGNKVEWIGSGGEVYSSLKNPEATKDQMGSGWQAQAGWTKAAFLRNLRNQSDMNGAMVNNNGFPTEDAATSGGADPYTIQMDMESGSTWGSYFYVGGPTPAVHRVATR